MPDNIGTHEGRIYSKGGMKNPKEIVPVWFCGQFWLFKKNKPKPKPPPPPKQNKSNKPKIQTNKPTQAH